MTEKKIKINTSKTELFSKPNASSDILCSLDESDEYLCDRGWLHINSNGKTGWIKAQDAVEITQSKQPTRHHVTKLTPENQVIGIIVLCIFFAMGLHRVYIDGLGKARWFIIFYGATVLSLLLTVLGEAERSDAVGIIGAILTLISSVLISIIAIGDIVGIYRRKRVLNFL